MQSLIHTWVKVRGVRGDEAGRAEAATAAQLAKCGRRDTGRLEAETDITRLARAREKPVRSAAASGIL